MRFCIVGFIFATVVLVECGHTFLGTNVQRSLAYHYNAEYSSKVFRKRVENLFYSLPAHYINDHRAIRGILVFDLKFSDASANVTQGGIGFNFVNIRMKSERGVGLHYDIYIYV